MKTKQLGIFACVAALVLIVSLSSSTVYAKDRQVVIFDCSEGGVGAIEQTETEFELVIPKASCANTVAFLLNNKYKIEAVVNGVLLHETFGIVPTVNYTMVKK
ncbi:MAG: hypothetical protein IIB03_10265 [Acidobacteria bacterium]|nr:hypothetical protein [Acidobacteriota bacterium]